MKSKTRLLEVCTSKALNTFGKYLMIFEIICFGKINNKSQAQTIDFGWTNDTIFAGDSIHFVNLSMDLSARIK